MWWLLRKSAFKFFYFCSSSTFYSDTRSPSLFLLTLRQTISRHSALLSGSSSRLWNLNNAEFEAPILIFYVLTFLVGPCWKYFRVITWTMTSSFAPPPTLSPIAMHSVFSSPPTDSGHSIITLPPLLYCCCSPHTITLSTQTNLQPLPSFEDKSIMHVTLSSTLSTDLWPLDEESGDADKTAWQMSYRVNSASVVCVCVCVFIQRTHFWLRTFKSFDLLAPLKQGCDCSSHIPPPWSHPQ